MNHPHQSERTRARSGPPVFNPGLSARDLPTTQKNETNPISGSPDKILTTDDWRLKAAFNKTNPIPPANLHSTIYNLMAQFPLGPRQNMRNEPNLPSPHPGTTKTRETNPISPRQKMQNKPNPHPFQAYHAGRRSVPIYRETQSPSRPRPKMRNEPNFISPRASCPKNAKRTQSPPSSSLPRWPKVSPDAHRGTQSPYGQGPGTSGCPHYAKQTQFTTPYTVRNIQYTIPWPNFPLTPVHERTYSKITPAAAKQPVPPT